MVTLTMTTEERVKRLEMIVARQIEQIDALKVTVAVLSRKVAAGSSYQTPEPESGEST